MSLKQVYLVALLIVMSIGISFGQVRVDFLPRQSSQAPSPYTNQKNYNLQGDFKMLGNTNLTLVNYAVDGTSSSNDNPMKYVDVDNVPGTVNSSMSELVLDGGSCTEIIYAGLYWSGRAHNGGTSAMSFDVPSTQTGPIPYNNTNFDWRSGFLENTSYRLDKSRINNGSSDRYPRYTLSTTGSGQTYWFELTNSSNNSTRLRVSKDGGVTWTNLTLSSYSNGVATLSSTYVIQDGAMTIAIKKVTRNTSSTGNSSSYTNSNNFITADVSGTIVGPLVKTLYKNKVKLKWENDAYQEFDAGTNIRYPSNADGNMYAAYADVTEYVRENGVGKYYVADMAIVEGNGGSTGYYGGWGMVVIYKNPTKKWRNITVFDGYAYMASQGADQRIPVTGFRAAQGGDVNVTLGVMAGEGDRTVTGDYLKIQKAGTTGNSNSHWTELRNSEGNTNNFFNSAIGTGANNRNPNLINNTGVDIRIMDLPNANQDLIRNNETKTQLLYGTSADTYIIYNLVLAVDAYVPEIIAENIPTNPAIASGNSVPAGGIIEFKSTIKNRGSEAVKNGKVTIDLPWNVYFVPDIPANSAVTWTAPVGAPAGATFVNTPGGTLTWTIGEIGLPPTNDKEKVLAELKYKVRVIDNCTLLNTSACELKIDLDGRFSGSGKNSDLDAGSGMVTGYNADCGNSPIYGSFSREIDVTGISCNDGSVDNQGFKNFNVFCSGSKIARNDIVTNYPFGTKFYTGVPGQGGTTEVTGDFDVNSDAPKKYYAVVVGMPAGCYLKLQTSLEKVTTSPVAKDIEICKGQEVVLDVQLSQVGQTNGYNLYYFNPDGSQLSEAPKPTAVGTYSYKVAEGKKQGGQICFGPKVDFKIVIHDLPTVATTEANVSLCENNDHKITINTTGATAYVWEYTTSTAPNSWQTLSNSTFSNNISVSNNTLNISHAPKVINGLKVRLKVDNGKCPAVSNEILIEVKDCRVITNPMLPNKARKAQ